VSPVKYELGFYIPEDDILHSHCCENLKSYIIVPLRSDFAIELRRTMDNPKVVCFLDHEELLQISHINISERMLYRQVIA
jgi:hypothetical protein